MHEHDMQLRTNKLFHFWELQWCHRAECKCGANSGPLWMSRKSCYRWFRAHKEGLDFPVAGV